MRLEDKLRDYAFDPSSTKWDEVKIIKSILDNDWKIEISPYTWNSHVSAVNSIVKIYDKNDITDFFDMFLTNGDAKKFKSKVRHAKIKVLG